MRVTIARALTLIVSCAAVSLTGAAPTPVPDVKGDMSSMRFNLGTWTCHGSNPQRPGDRVSTAVTTMDMDGHFFKTVDDSPPFDKRRTRHFVSTDYLTFNPRTHQWVDMYFDNFGGYGASVSDGWHGNTMTWKSTLASDGTTSSGTVTKVSDTQTTGTNTDAKGLKTTSKCMKTG